MQEGDDGTVSEPVSEAHALNPEYLQEDFEIEDQVEEPSQPPSVSNIGEKQSISFGGNMTDNEATVLNGDQLLDCDDIETVGIE